MYQPRKSILQMFDPLMVNPPTTPKREESNASPDNSDKENDLPRDPLSLSQYFNRTYHVKSSQKQATPHGKLIDFGDDSIDESDEPSLPGPSAVATGPQPDDGEALLSALLPVDPHEESDIENSPFPSGGPFTTPQNRRILGDIDVDALEPPKPPTKQGTLKISFLTTPNGGSPSAEAPTTNLASSDPEPDGTIPGPVITLYPPVFDSIPPTSSAPQISDKVDNYLSPQLCLPRTVSAFTPRRSPLSSAHTSHRVSIDLQSSFQLQLQNGDYSFDLVNDKVSFLESSQELSFPDSEGDLDVGEVLGDVNVDDMLKSLTLQDKAAVATTRITSPTSEELAITMIPERDPESSFNSDTPRATSPTSLVSPQDLPELRSTRTTLNIMKKPVGFIHRPSLASRPFIPNSQPAAPLSKPPMRIPVPPSKRLSNVATQHTSMVRPPSRQPSTIGSLSKPVVAVPKIVGKSTCGPRRVLVEASDKPDRTAPTSIAPAPAPKTLGPQRVLTRTASTTTNPAKKPLGPSSSVNPPAPASRLPGPSRIAVPSTSKIKRTSSIPKPVGRWV